MSTNLSIYIFQAPHRTGTVYSPTRRDHLDTIVTRCAGLDVHKNSVVACVRFPDDRGGRMSASATFGTTTTEVLKLADWLASHGVTLVGMEATGVYWKPVLYVLEHTVECWLLNARHLHHVPGRKTDLNDAAWIAQLIEHGLVRPSFVPPPSIRELRNLTRYRRAQIEERTRETQRLDKLLQDAGIKLSSVASDTLGKSGRAMLDALVTGTNDPAVVADLAQGLLRRKIPALHDALQGRFSGHHQMLVGTILDKLDYLNATISRLDGAIEQAVAEHTTKVELLTTIPGVGTTLAQALIGEIGVDMDRFGSAARLASWAGMCPGQHESAGKSKSGKTRKGSKWLRANLTQAAKAAARTKDTYLAAKYRRIKARRGHAKATIAVGHSILIAAFHILRDDVPYHDLGGDYFDRRDDPQRRVHRLAGHIRRLGYDVALTPTA